MDFMGLDGNLGVDFQLSCTLQYLRSSTLVLPPYPWDAVIRQLKLGT